MDLRTTADVFGTRVFGDPRVSSKLISMPSKDVLNLISIESISQDFSVLELKPKII